MAGKDILWLAKLLEKELQGLEDMRQLATSLLELTSYLPKTDLAAALEFLSQERSGEVSLTRTVRRSFCDLVASAFREEGAIGGDIHKAERGWQLWIEQKSAEYPASVTRMFAEELKLLQRHPGHRSNQNN